MTDMATDPASPAGQDGLVATTTSSSSASGPDRPKRRTFTAEYKLAVLEEYEQAATPLPNGARCCAANGCCPRTFSEWRKARRGGSLKALESGKRKPAKSPAEIENEKLRKQKEKLARELAKTKAALDIVGKAHALLEMLSESADSDAKRQK